MRSVGICVLYEHTEGKQLKRNHRLAPKYFNGLYMESSVSSILANSSHVDCGSSFFTQNGQRIAKSFFKSDDLEYLSVQVGHLEKRSNLPLFLIHILFD